MFLIVKYLVIILFIIQNILFLLFSFKIGFHRFYIINHIILYFFIRDFLDFK